MGELNWAALGVLATVAAGWSVVLLFAVRWMLGSLVTTINQRFTDVDALFLERFNALSLRFDDMEQARSEDVKELQRIERMFMEFRADLPKEYVRREDWIRFAAVIDAKQDTLNEKIERLLERGTVKNVGS